MRKLMVIILLTCSACFAGYNYLPSADEGSFVAMEGGYYVWSAGALPPTSALILEYLMGANGSESTVTLDTSGNSYTGAVSGAVWQPYTNGITDNYNFDTTADQIVSTDAISYPDGITWSF